MPRANAFIPVAKGIDQKLDERLRDADSLQVVINGKYKRGNALAKRNGFTRIAASSPTSDARALISSGDELLLRSENQLYSLVEPTTAVPAYSWLAKGEVAPFTGAERPIFSDNTSCISHDSAAADGIVLHVGASVRYTDPSTLVAGYTTELRYRIENENTQAEIVSTATLLTSAVASGGIGGVKAVAAGTGANARISFAHTQPSLSRLEIRQLIVPTPTATPAVLITHNDLYVAAGDTNFRRYDMTSLAVPNTATWSYAYIKTAIMGGPGDIFVATYNGAALLGSWTIPPPAGTNWNWVAIADDVANSRILVCAIDATQQIRLYSQNRTTGLTFWTRLMHTTPQPCTGLAVAQGAIAGGTSNVVIANSASTGGATSAGSYNITASYTDTSGVALSGVQRTYNAVAVSKPWFVNSRCYFTARARYGRSPAPQLGSNFDVPFSSEVVFDLLGGGTTAPYYPSIVARYNHGVAPTKSNLSPPYDEGDLGLGSLGEVQRHGTVTSKWRMSTRRVIGAIPFREYIQAADELVLDFAGITTNASTTRGTVALGGADVCWYSGGRVEELGYASAPVFSATVAIGLNPGTSTLDHGTYSYIAIFTSYDEKGNLMRSMPSAPVSVTISGGGGGTNHYIETQWFILGATQRWDAENWYSISLFRAGSDGVYRRCIQPLKEAFGVRNSNYFLTIRDNGEAYDVLYTQGGAELEATGPDGASFVAVTSKRVWLAGFFRRDRIQYSKLYTPATANEFSLAPEFNDAFSFLLPGGENVTGIVEMDDKTIVFTSSNIYAIAGNGPDDGGRGNDYSGLQLIASDTGCIEPRSIVASPIGTFFRGSSGIFVLGRDLQLTFIGAAVRDITDVYTEITSAVLVPKDNHVRFTCRVDGFVSVILVYDFDQTAWMEWQPRAGLLGQLLNIVGACLHRGVYHVLDKSGAVFFEDESTWFDDSTLYTRMTIRTGWLQITQQSGWQRIRKVAAMCKALDAHELEVQVWQDFEAASSQTFTWSWPNIQNMRLNELVEMHIDRQKCTAFQVQVRDLYDATNPPATGGAGYECAGFSVELSGKRGLYKPGTQQRN